MKTRGRILRFAAVSVAVVLCLTGFTTGRGHGHRSGGNGSGGGCSSSRQDHDSSSSSSRSGVYKDDDRDDLYGSGSYRDPYDGYNGRYNGGYNDHHDDHGSGGASGTSGSDRENATVRLLSCATKRKPYATVEVTNPSSIDGRFVVTVTFKDARNLKIASKQEEAEVPADGKTIVRVPVPRRAPIAKVDHCDLSPKAPPAE